MTVEAEVRWYCLSCTSIQVTDRVLATIATTGGSLQIHRVTCRSCGAVGHYDRHLEKEDSPTKTVNEQFQWSCIERQTALAPSSLWDCARGS